MIIFEGYYISDGYVDEEWHAGAHMKYRTFFAFSFYKYGNVKVASKRTSIDIDRCVFSEIEFKSSKSLNNFIIDKSKLKIYRNNGQIYQELEIIDDNKIIDECGLVYFFRPFKC